MLCERVRKITIGSWVNLVQSGPDNGDAAALSAQCTPMSRSIYSVSQPADDAQPGIAQGFCKCLGVMDALRCGAATADHCQCGSVEQIQPPLHIQQQRRIGYVQQRLGIIVVGERDDMVIVIFQPNQGRVNNLVGNAPADFCGDIHLDRGFE